MPYRALFFNVPAHGHINPSLPLVAELARRGHHLTYFATVQFRPAIEAAGAVFRPYAEIGDDYFEGPGLDGSRPRALALALLQTTRAILPELLETGRELQPDYVLFDGMCPWGYFVARILDMPAVASLALMPGFRPPLQALLNRWLLRAVLSIRAKDFSKGVQANRLSQTLGRQYGVPPPGPQSLLSAEGDISLSYTSSYFQPFVESVSPTVRFVGRVLEDESTDASELLGPAGDRPLVYISLGTLINKDRAFFERCIEAFAGRDEYVILSTGNGVSPASFGAVPANISISAWVPQRAVLKRAALFVTHGGMSSVHDGLYFGVPLLLRPQQGEQAITALRVAELGAGLILEGARPDAGAILARTTRLLSEPGFVLAAERIGETFRAAGGAKTAADEVENLLQK